MGRLPLLALLLIVSVLLAGCGQYGKKYTGEATRAAGDGEETPITDEKFDEQVRKRDGCTEVREFESEGSSHRSDIDDEVDYKHNPPHSGDHYQVAAEWGVYDKQLRDVQVVHNLEHGHIAITYKGLTDDQREELLEHVEKNRFHLLVHPRDDNPKKGVYYTAWTAQLYCRQPSAAALQYMIENWRDKGPELLTDDPAKGHG